jgi:dynactin complex subunit
MTLNDLREWLESRLDRMGDQLGRLESHQAEMNVTQVKQAKDIEHHIRRTDLLDDFSKNLGKQMVELMEHIHQVRGVVKFFGILSVILGLIATTLKIFAII